MQEVAPRVAVDVRSFEEITRGGEDLREALLLHSPPSHLIIDEAHELRNATAKRTQLLLGKAGYFRRIPFVWAVGGTPFWKNVGSLWTVAASIFAKEVRALGIITADDWYNTFAEYTWEPQEYGPPKRKVWGVKNLEKMRAFQAETMLRRTLADTGMQVPPMTWTTLLLDAVDTPKWSLDQSEIGEAVRQVEDWVQYGTEHMDGPLAVMRHELGDYKAPLVAQHVADELGGDPEFRVVLYAHHLSVMDALESRLSEFGVMRVDGSTSEKVAWSRIEQFNSEQRHISGKNARVFLGQNHAVSVGIPLHSADTAIFVEPDWTASKNFQLSQRIVSLGDSRPKMIQFATLGGTLDEAIQRQHAREAEMQDILGG